MNPQTLKALHLLIQRRQGRPCHVYTIDPAHVRLVKAKGDVGFVYGSDLLQWVMEAHDQRLQTDDD